MKYLNRPAAAAWSLGVTMACVVGAASLPVGAAPRGGLAAQEAQRRQEGQALALVKITEAEALMAEGKSAEAVAKYRTAVALIPAGGEAGRGIREQAVAGLAEVAQTEARALAANGQMAQAETLLAEILGPDMFPDHEPSKALQAQLRDPDHFNPAVTPRHVDNTAKVSRLLMNGGQLIELGLYDAAKASYTQVLAIDTTNSAARRGMEQADRFINVAQRAARDANRASMLNAVSQVWEMPTTKELPIAAAPGAPAEEGLQAYGGALTAKLDQIVLPTIRLDETGLRDAVAYLVKKSIELDGADARLGGVDIVVRDDASTRPITLNVRNFTLRQAITTVCEQAGAKWEMQAGAVVVSAGTGSAAMSSRTFSVSPGFLTTMPSAVTTEDPAADPFGAAGGAGATKSKFKRLTAREFLEGQGIDFPDGARANYNASNGQLTVRNTDANLDVISQFVEGLSAKDQKQVRIRVTMLDASQVTLNELGFDHLVGPFSAGRSGIFGSGGTPGNSGITGAGLNPPGTVGNTPSLTQGVLTAGLRSSFDLNSPQTITDLVGQGGSTPGTGAENRSPAFFSFAGVFTNPQFNTFIRGLNQKKGVDVSAASDLVLKSGQRASSFAGREIFYPTEFDPPQIPQTNTGTTTLLINQTGGLAGAFTSNSQAPVTPTTPSTFAPKKLGAEIEVEATIGSDGYSVDVNLNSVISDFEGFINYGTPITNGDIVLTDNRILQPVFTKTAANAQVMIGDGQTIAVGGLKTAKHDTIEDKVPIFSSLPVVGRLFKSRVKRDSRRVIVFFLSANIIDATGASPQHTVHLPQ